ncbi:hypothetical protein ACHHYP_14029 [Achlya hypogyna]|uniref:Uncharacterized protein n=1 Tax=Achlya hypogyna TaxID=1202772 RepID=A0A1V9YE72_ACHHY|nr:hypothetical protein ACHHYP_14029 [Achlya hypogyna]
MACPYQAFTSTYTADWCDAGYVYCIVDSNCKLNYRKAQTATFQKSTIGSVGDLSKSDVKTLSFVALPGLDFSRAVFPQSLEGLYATNNPTLTSLENINFGSTQGVAFNGSPITKITNIVVGPQTRTFLLGKAALTTFLVSDATRLILEKTTSFAVGSIDVSASCVAPNKIMPLKSYSVPNTPNCGSWPQTICGAYSRPRACSHGKRPG